MAEAIDAAQQQAQPQNWAREQFQKANRFLAEKGIIPNKVIVEECRYFAPYLAIWKISASKPSKTTYWVINGDLSSDLVTVDAAKDAREVLRHFSLAWQLKAENLIQNGLRDETQKQYVNLLITRAESMFTLYQDDKLWQSVNANA